MAKILHLPFAPNLPHEQRIERYILAMDGIRHGSACPCLMCRADRNVELAQKIAAAGGGNHDQGA